MEARQHRADDLRDAVGDLVLILRHAAERHIAALELKLFGLLERTSELLRDFLRDRVAGHGNRAVVDLLVLEDDEVGRLRTHVENHRAPAELGIGELQRVADRDRRNVHHHRLETGRTHGIRHRTHALELRRHDQRRLVALRRHADELVVADDFVDRERDVLLDLVADLLFGVADGRNLRKPREDHLAAERHDERPRTDSLLAHDLVDR